jgi:CPA2 family monovalent cation:H+ antiporter-2
MGLGQPVQSAALLGAAAAMSSTALVSRQLADQGELTARHGRSAIAVLVSFCIVVAAAAAAHAAGVSAALGAFLAGMVLGESDFKHHMENHLKPFRNVLSGVFFVTIGLQLDGAQVFSAPLAVLAWLLALVPVKILLNTLALRATRLSALDAWRTGIALGHGGEFGLLLLGMVLQQHLMSTTLVQPMLVALVLSMAMAPLLIRHHDALAQLLSRTRGTSAPL